MKEMNTEMLAFLRQAVSARMSPKRLRHTLAVEEMAERLCALYCPQHILALRAAALLHDLTKELSLEEQVALCRKYGLSVSDGDLLSPKTFHARTAAALIPDAFPQFATPTVINAVRWHTTGHAGMTLTEKLIYLADYIDLSRTYPACVFLRDTFFAKDVQAMSGEERIRHLHDVLLLSYDLTLKDLIEEGAPIAPDTVKARNEILLLKNRSKL